VICLSLSLPSLSFYNASMRFIDLRSSILFPACVCVCVCVRLKDSACVYVSVHVTEKVCVWACVCLSECVCVCVSVLVVCVCRWFRLRSSLEVQNSLHAKNTSWDFCMHGLPFFLFISFFMSFFRVFLYLFHSFLPNTPLATSRNSQWGILQSELSAPAPKLFLNNNLDLRMFSMHSHTHKYLFLAKY